MRSRPARQSRPSVRLISYQSAPGAGPPPVARTAGPRRLRAVPPPDGNSGVEVDLEAVAYVIAQAFAEVLAGMRPLHHLAGRATPDVYDRLAAALPAVPTSRRLRAAQPLRVTTPRVQEPAPGVAEVCAVVFLGARAQALALRLKRFRGRWRCSAVETTISPRQALPGQMRSKSA